MIRLATTLIGFLAASGAFAAECGTIQDDTKRLACYDTAAKSAATAQPAAKEFNAPATAPYRNGYAHELQKIFLGRGVDISVMTQEADRDIDKGREAKFRKYPKLIFFGYMSRPLVFQMLSHKEIFPNSKKLGFKMIEFFDKGAEGRWFFDLTGAELPKCDINSRICL